MHKVRDKLRKAKQGMKRTKEVRRVPGMISSYQPIGGDEVAMDPAQLRALRKKKRIEERELKASKKHKKRVAKSMSEKVKEAGQKIKAATEKQKERIRKMKEKKLSPR